MRTAANVCDAEMGGEWELSSVPSWAPSPPEGAGQGTLVLGFMDVGRVLSVVYTWASPRSFFFHVEAPRGFREVVRVPQRTPMGPALGVTGFPCLAALL